MIILHSFSWKLCCFRLGILIWIEKQGWIQLSNADRRHNFTESLGGSLHYASKERAIPYVVLGKPPAPAVTPHHANPESLQLHYLGGLYGRQRGTIRSPFKNGLVVQPPAVRNSRGCLSYREQPFPKMMSFLGQPTCDDWMRGHLKVWTFWLNVGRWWKKTFSRVLCWVGRAFWGLLHSLIPSSVYSVSSPFYSHMRIPNKHLAPQTWPGSCFWRT